MSLGFTKYNVLYDSFHNKAYSWDKLYNDFKNNIVPSFKYNVVLFLVFVVLSALALIPAIVGILGLMNEGANDAMISEVFLLLLSVLLAIIFGFIFLAFLFLVQFAPFFIVLEKKGVIESMKLSKNLILSGNVVKILSLINSFILFPLYVAGLYLLWNMLKQQGIPLKNIS